MKNKKNKKNKGFTIVELIVVMAIIAILILMAVPVFTKYIERAERVSEMGTANTIYKSTMASVTKHNVTYKPTGESEFPPDGWIYWNTIGENIIKGVSGNVVITTGPYENIDQFYEEFLERYAQGFPANWWLVYYNMQYDYTNDISTVGGPIIVVAPTRNGRRNVYQDDKYVFDVNAEDSYSVIE